MPFGAVVDGADGVDDVFAGEGVGGGYFGGAGGAAVEGAAFVEEGGTGGGVDGAVLFGGVSFELATEQVAARRVGFPDSIRQHTASYDNQPSQVVV